VRLKDLKTDEAWEFRLVGSYEADPAEDRISVESPVGRAVLGHKVRQDVEVHTPAGVTQYRILKITK